MKKKPAIVINWSENSTIAQSARDLFEKCKKWYSVRKNNKLAHLCLIYFILKSKLSKGEDSGAQCRSFVNLHTVFVVCHALPWGFLNVKGPPKTTEITTIAFVFSLSPHFLYIVDCTRIINPSIQPCERCVEHCCVPVTYSIWCKNRLFPKFVFTCSYIVTFE